MKTEKKQRFSIICYCLATLCLILSIGMEYSIRTGNIKELLYRTLLLDAILIVSIMTALLGIAKFFICISKKNKKQVLYSCIMVFMSFFSVFTTIRFIQHNSFAHKVKLCQIQLRNLFGAMTVYHHEYGIYPTADQWCDLVSENMKKNEPGYDFSHRFHCAGGEKGSCNYAMNSNVTKGSNEEIVLIFDSFLGWNQHGQQEMINFNNHEGKGANVLFTNGKIKFIPNDKIDTLQWSE